MIHCVVIFSIPCCRRKAFYFEGKKKARTSVGIDSLLIDHGKDVLALFLCVNGCVWRQALVALYAKISIA